MRWIALFAVLLIAGLSFSLTNITNCSVLSTAGETYQLTQNISGAPFTWYSGAYRACILVNASNIVFDCRGYKISPSGGSYPTGVVTSQFTNITVKNCIIDGYGGLALENTNDSLFSNNTVYNAYYSVGGLSNPGSDRFIGNTIHDSSYGFFSPCDNGYCVFANNSLYNLEYNAIYESGDYNVFSGNNLTDVGSGATSGSYCNFTNNRLDGVTYDAFEVTGDYNYYFNNTVQNVGGYGFIMDQVSYNRLDKNTVLNSSGGFIIDDTVGGGESYNNITNSTSCNNTGNGFEVLSSEFDYLFNNTACFNGGDGFYVYDTNSTNLTLNTAYDNTWYGFEFDGGRRNILRSNTAYNNLYGVYTTYITNFSFINNTAYSNVGGFGISSASQRGIFSNNNVSFNTGDGISMAETSNHTFINNTANSNDGNGVSSNTVGSLIFVNNTANSNGQDGFALDSNGLIMNNNTASNNTVNGISVWSAANVDANNNTASFNGGAGIWIGAYTDGNNFTGNRAFNNTNGFYSEDNSNNTLINNSAYQNSWAGFIFNRTLLQDLSNNTAYGNIFGIWLFDTNDSRMQGSSLHDNSYGAIVTSNNNAVTGVNMSGNRIFDNAQAGVYLESQVSYWCDARLSDNIIEGNYYGLWLPTGYFTANLSNNTIANSTVAGYQYDNYFGGNIILDRDTLQGNPTDVNFSSGASALQLSITDVIFGNAAGSYGVNTSISHSTSSRTWGILDWVSAPSPPSAALATFGNKSVNVTPNRLEFSGNYDVVMKWNPAEGGSPAQQATIQMWLTNTSGNFLLNSSPDVANRMISASIPLTENASSIVSLFFTTGCPLITVPGVYTQDKNLSGAPNNGSHSYNACVLIATDNVVYDCAGYNITNNGTSNAAGIMVNGTDSSYSNITIRNCNVKSYDSAVLIDNQNPYFKTVNVTGNNLTGNVNGVNVPNGYAKAVMSGNLVANNTGAGYRLSNYFADAINVTNDRFLGNGNDFSYPSGGSSLTISLRDVIMGSADGSYAVNASASHYTSSRTYGVMDWVPSPSPPASRFVFLNKSINVTQTYMDVERGFNFSMSWGSGEGTPSQWNYLELWLQNDSGSYLLNSSPDTSGRTISASVNMTNATSSVLSLFERNPNCPVVDSSGIYAQTQNFIGAPNLHFNGAFFDNVCVLINKSNVDWDCAGYNITNNGTDTSFGVYVAGPLSNVTIRNCPNVSGYVYGVYVYNTTNAVVRNSTAGESFQSAFASPYSPALFDNDRGYGSGNGFYVTSSNNVTNCTATNNTNGFYLDGGLSTGSRFINNTAAQSTNSGFNALSGANNNLFSLNVVYNSTVNGFNINSNNNNITNNTVYNSGSPGISVLGNANQIRDNVARNSSSGIYLANGNSNTVSNNSAYNNTNYGIYLASASGNNVTNNTAFFNSVGIYVSFSPSNLIANNTAYRNGNTGFQLISSNLNTVANNSAYNNTFHGFYVWTGANNTLAGNRAFFNSNNGFYFMTASTLNNVTNNTVYNNSQNGVYLSSCDNNALANNTIYNNSGAGVYAVNASGTRMSGDHLFNNGRDLRAESSGTAFAINLSNVIFDAPAGLMTLNYTNLSINDTVDASSAYTINWSVTPTMPDTYHVGFAGKFVNISVASGTTAIDRVAWTWLPSEVTAGYNESKFQLWKQNSSGWKLMNGTPDLTNHELSLTGMNPASIYGILNGTDNCPIIDASGTAYTQSRDFVGAPNDAFPPTGGSACVKIMASNVVYDCNGFNITDNGTAGDHYGILLNMSATNVTVRNCRVSGYSAGVVLIDASGNNISNVTSSDNSLSGIMLTGQTVGSHNNNIANNRLYNNSNGLQVIFSSSNSTIRENNVSGNSGAGILLGTSSNWSRIMNNTAYGNAQGFYLLSTNGNNITFNRAYNNSDGFRSSGSSNMLIANNTVSNNSAGGFVLLSGSNNNLLQNNTAVNSSQGFYIDTGSSNQLAFNTATNNSLDGIFIQSANLNSFANNNISGGANYGIRIYSSSNNAFANNTVSGVAAYAVYVRSAGNNFTNNTIYGNPMLGVYIYDADNTRMARDHLYNNGRDIRVESSGTAFTVNLSNVIIDAPAGLMTLNYTNLSINDSVDASSAYSVNWTITPAMPEVFLAPFAGKFVDISTLAGTTSIDRVAWTWLPSEVTAGYVESKFQLWKRNGSGVWSLQNGSPDTTNHVLSLSAMNPASVYGILNATDNCPVVSSSYVQTRNFVGAPNPTLDGYACVVINASNIVYDCNGFNITNNESSTTSGIFVNNGLSNVTLKNCGNISRYSYGAYLYANSLVRATNNTVYNATQSAFYIYTGSNNAISDNRVRASMQAVRIQTSNVNNVTGNNISNCNSDAMQVVGSYNRVSGNNATLCSSGAMVVGATSTDNVLSGNRFYGMYQYGIHLNSAGINNVVANNSLNSNTIHGIYLNGAGSNNLVSNNNATSNTQHGIYLWQTNGTNVTGNNASGNSQDGISLSGSVNNRIINNTAIGNGRGIFLSQSSSNNMTGNALTANANYGIYLSASPRNLVSGNNASANMFGIRMDGVSHNNTVDSNAIRSNTADGIVVSIAEQNNITRNNITLNYNGIYLSAPRNRVQGNNVSNNTNIGIYATGGSTVSNLIADNIANSNTNYGIFVSASDNNYNNLTNNTANQNFHGIWVQDSEYNILRNNRAGNNTGNGIYIGTAAHNTLADNNTAADNADYGIYLISSDNCNLTNNMGYGNGDGLDAESASALRLAGNVMHDNDGFGMRVWNVALSTLSNNTAYNNPYSGIVLRESLSNAVTDNWAYNNDEVGIYLASSDSNSVVRNNASQNGLSGIFLNMSDGNTLTDNLADSNVVVAMGMDNSTLNSIARCNASNGLYGFVFVRSPSNNLTDSLAHGFTDLNDGGGNPDITTGGRAVYLFNGSNNNLVRGNTLYNASIFGVDVDHSNFTTSRNNTVYDIGQVGLAALRATGTTFALNDVSSCLLGAVVLEDCRYSNVTDNRLYDNQFVGVYIESSGWSRFTNNTINNNYLGFYHQDSNATRLEYNHYYNNLAGDFNMSMAFALPGLPLNMTEEVFDNPSGNYQNYTVLSLDDTMGVEGYIIHWTTNASSLPLPPNTFSFAQKYITINGTAGNATIDRLAWHWLEGELGETYGEDQFQLWEYSGGWAQRSDADLDLGANTLTIINVTGFSDFAILQNIPMDEDEVPPETEEPLDVRIIPACQGFIVQVKDGGSPVENAFLKIRDQSADTELAPRYTNASGQAYVSTCDIDVSIKASKAGKSGTESGMAECGFCPECATDDDCALTEQCVGQLCVPIDCPNGMVVDHACERFECVKDSDCKANQTCVNHHCKTVYECDYGLANTTEDDNADCDDNEYCDVPVGQPGGSCKPITGCGEIKDHTITRWECGDAEGCPACAGGELCISHACVQGDLACPASGVVGDNKTCLAKEDGKPCVNCDYEVTQPDGKKLTGRTDQSGNLALPLKLSGTYRVALLKDNQTIKVLSVKALPKSGIGEEEPPSGAGGMDAGTMALFLIILLAAVFGAILYMRRGKKEKKPEKKPDKK